MLYDDDICNISLLLSLVVVVCVVCLLTLVQASCRSKATNGTDSKDMDSTARKAANLNVLKRQDADITDIMDSASFVVIYRFDDATQAWVSFEQELSIAEITNPSRQRKASKEPCSYSDDPRYHYMDSL